MTEIPEIFLPVYAASPALFPLFTLPYKGSQVLQTNTAYNPPSKRQDGTSPNCTNNANARGSNQQNHRTSYRLPRFHRVTIFHMEDDE